DHCTIAMNRRRKTRNPENTGLAPPVDVHRKRNRPANPLRPDPGVQFSPRAIAYTLFGVRPVTKNRGAFINISLARTQHIMMPLRREASVGGVTQVRP